MRILFLFLFLFLLLFQANVYSQEYPLNLKKYNIKLPVIEDEELKTILYDPRTTFYKFPKYYQYYHPATTIEQKDLTRDVIKTIYVKEKHSLLTSHYLPEFNANKDFPWEITFGLNQPFKNGIKSYNSFNFIRLPEDKPIVILNEYPYKWIYPEGTIVGEAITVLDPKDNNIIIFEIRTRTKLENTWFPKIYRPIADLEEFNAITNKKLTTLPKKHIFLRNPEEDEVFKLEGYVEKIPNLEPELVRNILRNQPFKDVTDYQWNPASEIEFNIFPKDYNLGLLSSVDDVSCSNCHKQTQISVNRLIPKEPLIINNPEKVGNIRGSDGIFTWHPFDLSSINKDLNVKNPINLRNYDIQNRMIELYDENKHSDYKLTEFVEKALAPYELPKVKTVLNHE